jgi:hypothetical protein
MGAYSAVASTMPLPPAAPVHYHPPRPPSPPRASASVGLPPRAPSPMLPEPRVRAPSSSHATHEFTPREPRAPSIPSPHLAQGRWSPSLRDAAYVPTYAGKGQSSSSSSAVNPTKGAKGWAPPDKGAPKGESAKGWAPPDKGAPKGESYQGKWKGKGKGKGKYPEPAWGPQTFQSQFRPWQGNPWE